MGRPFTEFDLHEVKRLAKLGLTLAEIAYALGIVPETISRQKKRDPEFSRAIADGRSEGRAECGVNGKRFGVRPEFVYLFKLEGLDYYKIGMSRNVDDRLRHISTSIPFDITCIFKIEVDDCLSVEKYLHQRYSDKRVKGEWFVFSQHEVGDVIKTMGGFGG